MARGAGQDNNKDFKTSCFHKVSKGVQIFTFKSFRATRISPLDLPRTPAQFGAQHLEIVLARAFDQQRRVV